jgi:acylphosphatase
MKKSVSIRVRGIVQGVFFRQGTQRKALELGVNGYVQNEPDGSVSAHMEGEGAAVDALVAWCRRGPEAATVTGLDVEDAPHGGHESFDVRR